MKTLLTFVLFFAAVALPAQEPFWGKTAADSAAFEYVFGLLGDPCGGIMATTNNGLFRSTDQGRTWLRDAFIGEELVTGIIALRDGTILVGAWDSLFRSGDCGASWEILKGDSVPLVDFYRMVQGPDGAVYTATGFAHFTFGVPKGIWRTRNRGASWENLCFTAGFNYDLAVNAKGYIFLGIGAGYTGLQRSRDSGRTCEQVIEDRDWGGFRAVEALAIDSRGTIFAGVSAGGWLKLLRSFDDGDTWDSIRAPRPGLPDAHIYSLFVDREDRLYLGSGGNGVARSTDQGQTWDSLRGEFSNSELVLSFAVDSAGYLYAGANKSPRDGLGFVYRSREPIYTVNSVSSQAKDYASLRIVPNPAREEATLHVTLASPSRFTITLHDVLGRTVRRQPERFFNAGEHRLAMNTAGLAPGLYYCRLTTGAVVTSRPLIIKR